MKFDAKKAFDRIKSYYNFKKTYNEVSDNLTPSSVKRVLEQEIVQVLPLRDQLGRRIFIINVNSKIN
jgi:hypothetical protein